LKKLLKDTPHSLTEEQFKDLALRTEGYYFFLLFRYSGSDISTLVKDAAYEPLRISQKARKFKLTKNEKGEPAWIPVPPS
jgi:vacuolar protein-sorting-associated protein 4